MDRNRHESSAFSVPGVMQDITLLSTPLPKATSTATKRRTLMFDEIESGDLELPQGLNVDFKTKLNLADESNPDISSNPERLPSSFVSMNDTKRKLMEAYDSANKAKELTAKELADYKKDTLYRGTSSVTVISSPGLSKNSFRYVGNNVNNVKQVAMNEANSDKAKDFEFVVPKVPTRRLDTDSDNTVSGLTKYKTESQLNKKGLQDEFMARKDYLNDLPEKLVSSERRRYEVDRTSIASSTSSLGILSSDILDGAKNKLVLELSEAEKLELSLRLGKQLNLDTSRIKNGRSDINEMLCERMREKVYSRRRGGNKENSTRTSEFGSDLYSKNIAAKEFQRHSVGSYLGEHPDKSTTTSPNKRPLTEQNMNPARDSFLQKSNTSSIKSLHQDNMNSAPNPFGDFSKQSIASSDFSSVSNNEEILKRDEEAFKVSFGEGSMRSLSGIYGDCELSLRGQGEKLSISSYLRSKSGPLGCLEKVSVNSPRPNFGNPVHSPQKSKARPIRSPPENKLTFVMEDEKPTRDLTASWVLKSLMKEQSLTTSKECVDDDESEVSVPSLSRINQLLTDMKGKLSTQEVLNQLLNATSKNKAKAANTSASIVGCSVWSESGDREQVKSIAGNRVSFISLHGEAPGKPSGRLSTYNPSIITIEDSIIPSTCNITDFEVGGDVEYVCVLTPESMDFDVFNEYPREQHYEISKTCFLNNQKNESAALVHLSEDRIRLQPQEKRVINVTVAAAVEGSIKIQVEVIRFDPVTNDRETNSLCGKIIAEVPKIYLLSPAAVEMRPLEINGETSSWYKGELQLINNGLSVVPLKLLFKPDSNIQSFYFDENKCQAVKYVLGPGKTVHLPVLCQAPPILQSTETARAYVDVFLDTPVPVGLKSLQSVFFTVKINPNFLSAPANLRLYGDKTARCELYNNGPTTKTLEASVDDGFFVSPSKFTIPPNQSYVIHVGYQNGTRLKGQMMLRLLERTEIVHMINLTVQPQEYRSPESVVTGYGSVRSSINLVTPQNSRPTSPTSPCSNISSLGNLRLACTHKELVWGGCALQQKVIRNCTIKNLSDHREKLLLKITDHHKCFKIMNESNNLASEMKLCLQPQESRQLCVVMLAGSTGPKWAHLTIARLSALDDKKLLFLYAFGGKAKVSIEGVLQDPEQHMWLYLDSTTLSSSFTLTNTGDYTAFVKISEGITATTVGGGISIAPPEEILLPGQSVSVEISLSVTLERLEYLLAQPSQTAVCITRLTVTHGDESTRGRLTRLSRLDPKLASKLTQLSQLLPPTNIPDLNKLGDDCNCAETLWLEDVSEWSVGVLVKRSVLESLRLDTTFEFVDLATTVIH